MKNKSYHTNKKKLKLVVVNPLNNKQKLKIINEISTLLKVKYYS